MTDSEVLERVTEVGPPELIDRGPHPLATAIGVLLLVVVTALGVVGLASLVDEGSARTEIPEVVIPRLANRTMTEAQTSLEALGLIVDVRFEPNELVPPDVVVGQEPIAGARLEVGEQVVLVVSDGPVGLTVPDLRGGQASEAERILGILGLEMELSEVRDEDVPMGQIVGTEPSEGSRSAPGATVTVLVSLGPEPRTVPDVVGQLSHEAMAAIGRADLEIGAVTVRFVDDERVGRVLSTIPVAGAEVPRDQPIGVVVGSLAGAAEIPDLAGLSERSAVDALGRGDLRASVRREPVPPGDRRIGRVIRQSPMVGEPAALGSTVTIYVGAPTAPASAPPPVPPPPTPPVGG
jgi:eukaryotic-like serine/threonine-protein kinase